MLFQQVQDQLQWRAELLLSGRFEDLSREYVLPLALYLEDKLLVVRSATEFISLASDILKMMRAGQVHQWSVAVKAVELPRNGRFRVWSQCHERAGSCPPLRQSDLVQYMRQTAHGLQTEMVHYTRLGLPDLKTLATPAAALA